MATTLFNTNPVGGIDFTTAYTAPSSDLAIPGPTLAVGTTVFGNMGSRWVLVRLEEASTCTAGDVLIVIDNDDWIVQGVSNTNGVSKLGQLVGVAGATGTEGQYLWMQTAGYVASANVLTGATAFTALHSTATAGRIDDTASAGNSVAINGIVALATAASNAAACLLTNPVVGANDL